MLKKFVLGGMVVVAALLGNACGDDGSSDSPAGPEDSEVSLSSSSDDVALGSSEKNEAISSSRLSSSSSKKAVSSSSSSNEKSSSSSGKVESSSGKGEKSSSSKKVESSSSSKADASSSSTKNKESSSSGKPVESSSSKTKSSSSEISSSSVKPEESSSSEYSSSSLQETSSSSSEESSSSSFVGCIMGSLYDDRDGKTYKTVKIGEQEWMAENLNFEHSIGESAAQKSRCLYNDSSYCDKYGQLYPWTVAIDSALLDTIYNKKCGYKDWKNCSVPEKWKGICPNGWHLPTKAEWQQLVKDVGGEDVAAKKLKSATLWDGEDAVCFSALPAGKYAQYQFWSEGESAYFWMADFRKTNTSGAYNIYMVSNRDAHGTISVDMTYFAYSVRCIKN